MLRLAVNFVCFHVWIRLPMRWNATRPAMAMLARAGEYAYRDDSPTPPDPGHEREGGNG